MPNFIVELTPDEIKNILVDHVVKKYHPDIEYFSSDINYKIKSVGLDDRATEKFEGASIKIILQPPPMDR